MAFIIAMIIVVATMALSAIGLLAWTAASTKWQRDEVRGQMYWILGVGLTLALLVAASHYLPTW